MKSIVVIGASGQLGHEFLALCPAAHFVTRDQLNLYNSQSIQKFFENNKPDLIINCSAYTNVDLAEQEPNLAYQLNTIAPALLARMAKRFVHFSTDYVFDGMNSIPYSEEDPTSPLSVYGKTKAEGEKAVQEANENSVIIRTSWLYSKFGKNFVKTILKLGLEKKEIRIVGDKFGTPTYANDLAQLVVRGVVEDRCIKGGIYHFANEGVASWYDFAYEIVKLKGLKCKVVPIHADEYPLPAQRPNFSVLDKSKIKSHTGYEIFHWKESLIKCLREQF